MDTTPTINKSFVQKMSDFKINTSETYINVFLIVLAFVIVFNGFYQVLKLNSKIDDENLDGIKNESFLTSIMGYIMFYFGMSFILMFFVIPQIDKSQRFKDSLVYGGLFGALIYATFSFKNLADIEKWKFYPNVLTDIIWGFLYFTITAFFGSKFIA
jgi:uncharacterized membrane protein